MRIPILIFAAFVCGPALGQIQSIGPFSGDLQENFDQVDTCCSTSCIEPGNLFGGIAEFCDTGVGSMNGSTGFNLPACNYQPRSGARMGMSFEAYPEWTFQAPVRRVGGYIRTHYSWGNVRCYAYDAFDNEIGVVQINMYKSNICSVIPRMRARAGGGEGAVRIKLRPC